MNVNLRLRASQKEAILDGLKTSAMLTPAYIAFGMVTGISALQAGFSPLLALLSPAWIFGGSSQVVMSELIIAGAPLWVVVASAVLVNARMMVYSAAFNPLLKEARQSTRSAVGFFLVDQNYANHCLRDSEYERAGKPNREWLAYYLTISVALWLTWICTNALGIFLGRVIPVSWELTFSIPLCFVAIMGNMVRQSQAPLGMLIGAVLSLALFALPLKLGLVASVVIGVSILMALPSADRANT
ncbi:MAG: hypothetical protein RLZZ502_1755 [Pseudomonadota bacterium]